MKKLFLLLLLFIPVFCHAQLVGVAYQWKDFEKSQFAATMSVPYLTNLGKSNYVWMLNARLDYVSGSSEVSGLNLKPASFSITTANNYASDPVTVMLGCDAGYNINFTHGHSGLVLSPNLYIDYSFLYFKTGYDHNIFHNEGQFYIRVGICFGVGALKKLAKSESK